MTDKELEELKGYTEELYQLGNVSLKYCDSMIKFIESEQQRRVQSEDVQRAIEFQENLKNTIEYSDEEEDKGKIDIAIQALRQMQGWIPVSERLPRKEEFFVTQNPTEHLILTLINGDSEYCEIELIPVRHFEDIADYFENRHITHWMPLPQPPKGESK